MEEKPRILVVCGRNKRRSRTAEIIFKTDQRIQIRSAGLSPQSPHKINEKDIAWAQLILVMENNHRSKLKALFMQWELPEIVVLDIPDEYEYMDEELIPMIEGRINDVLANTFDL